METPGPEKLASDCRERPERLVFGTASQGPHPARFASETSSAGLRMSQSGFDRFRVPHGFAASTDLLHHRYQASPVQPRVEARLLRRSVTGKSLSRSDRSPPSTRRAFTLKFSRTVMPRFGSRHLKLLRLAFTAGEVGDGDPDHGLFGAIPSEQRRRFLRRAPTGMIPATLEPGMRFRSSIPAPALRATQGSIVAGGVLVAPNRKPREPHRQPTLITRPADRKLGDQENSYKCSAAKNFRPSHVSN